MGEDKIFIEINREKAEARGIDFVRIESYINGLFCKYGMFKDKSGWYAGGIFETIGVVIFILFEQDWFVDCADKLYWYDGDTGGTEDVLYHHRTGEARYVEVKNEGVFFRRFFIY